MVSLFFVFVFYLLHPNFAVLLATGGSLSCKKFYICIHKPEAASTSQVLNYISKLYSKVWNEAALKNIFDIQCCVVSDALEGIITRDQILQHENLTRVMTFDTSHGVELNENRRKSNLGEIECVDVNQCANKLREEYHQQPSIIVLDSHYEEQLSEVPIYERVALGGTFDNMHYGHCKLLTLSALACSKQLIIGITGDSMLADKSNAAMITDFATRSSAVGRGMPRSRRSRMASAHSAGVRCGLPRANNRDTL